MHSEMAPDLTDSLATTPEEPVEIAVFQQVKAQPMGRLLQPNVAAGPSVPLPRKYARLRRSEVFTGTVPNWWLEDYGYNPWANSSMAFYFDPMGDDNGDGILNSQAFAQGVPPVYIDKDNDGFPQGEDTDDNDVNKHPPPVTELWVARKKIETWIVDPQVPVWPEQDTSSRQIILNNWGVTAPGVRPFSEDTNQASVSCTKYLSPGTLADGLASLAFPQNNAPPLSGASEGSSVKVTGRFVLNHWDFEDCIPVETRGWTEAARVWLVRKPKQATDFHHMVKKTCKHYLYEDWLDDDFQEVVDFRRTMGNSEAARVLTVPAGSTHSAPTTIYPEPTDLTSITPTYYTSPKRASVAEYSCELDLLPVELLSDLNNDGQITSADSGLRVAALKAGASDADKEKGTEYLFINDKMSNGVWDADDDGVMSYSYGSGYGTMPKPPASHKVDDDAQELKVSVGGLSTGVVWFDHPTIDKLEFFKTKECKASDKLNMTSSSPFDLRTGTLPESIFMRLRDDWAGIDQEGNLRMFVGKTVNETWAELKLPVTVVRDFGAKHFFNAARDYILENNSRVCIRDHGYPFGPNPSVIFRLCMMREEATKMTAFDAKAGGQTGIEAAYYALPAVPRIPAVIINGNQCFWTAGWDEENPFDLPNMLGNIADKCHGRVIRGSVTAATSSDNFDPTTKPAAGSVLAGPDPIPAGNIAGPDGIAGTADDIPNPDAGDPGGKYVGYNSGAWTFAAGRAGGSDALGGLSTNYGSTQRANKAHQLMGYAKGVETGKGCIFTATQIKGVGYGTVVKGDASSAGVPALSPSADAGAIKLFILDSGAGSLALMHIDPAGTMRGAYLGRKTNWGAPYYVNNYLALDPAPARP
jgi:hypothetical protein